MTFLEPTAVTGLDKALVKLLVIFGAMFFVGLVVTTGSMVGLVRAIRRRRRGTGSAAAVLLAAVANAIAAGWLLYWLVYDIHDRSNPLNALLVINVTFCVLPLMWLVTAMRANRALQQ